MDYFESPRPDGPGLCSDNDCPCPNTELHPGSGYMFVSQATVDYRTDARSVNEAYAKMERTRPANTIVFHDHQSVDGVLMCEQGARLRKLDMATAQQDAQHWWRTGMIPLRATPLAGLQTTQEAGTANEDEIAEILDLVKECVKRPNQLWHIDRFLPFIQSSTTTVNSLQEIEDRQLLASEEEKKVLKSFVFMAKGLNEAWSANETKNDQVVLEAVVNEKALSIRPKDGLSAVGSLETCSFCGMGRRGAYGFQMYYGYKKHTTTTYQGGSTRKLSAHLTGHTTLLCCSDCLQARTSKNKKTATIQLLVTGALLIITLFFLKTSLDRDQLSIPLIPFGIATIVLLILGLSNISPLKNAMLLNEYRKRKEAEQYRKAIDRDIAGVRSSGQLGLLRPIPYDHMAFPGTKEDVAHTSHFWVESEYQDIFHGKGLDRELNG